MEIVNTEGTADNINQNLLEGEIPRSSDDPGTADNLNQNLLGDITRSSDDPGTVKNRPLWFKIVNDDLKGRLRAPFWKRANGAEVFSSPHHFELETAVRRPTLIARISRGWKSVDTVPENPLAFETLPEKLYDDYLILEGKYKELSTARKIILVEADRAVEGFNKNVLVAFGIGVGAGISMFGILNCRDMMKGALLMAGIFLLGVGVPFITSWRTLQRRKHEFSDSSFEELDFDESLKSWNGRLLQRQAEHEHDIRSVSIEMQARIDRVRKGLGPFSLSAHHNSLIIALMFCILMSVVTPGLVYLLYCLGEEWMSIHFPTNSTSSPSSSVVMGRRFSFIPLPGFGGL